MEKEGWRKKDGERGMEKEGWGKSDGERGWGVRRGEMSREEKR